MVHALLALSVACIETTRKSAMGVPKEIFKAKEDNRLLVWNSIVAVVVNFCLCFCQVTWACLASKSLRILGSSSRRILPTRLICLALPRLAGRAKHS